MDEKAQEKILKIIEESSNKIPDIFNINTFDQNHSRFRIDIQDIIGKYGDFISQVRECISNRDYVLNQLKIYYTMNRTELYNEQQKVDLLIKIINNDFNFITKEELKNCLSEINYIFGSGVEQRYRLKTLYTKYSIHLDN
jgi:hypothetical protein